jgi:type IV secretion system protein VirB10
MSDSAVNERRVSTVARDRKVLPVWARIAFFILSVLVATGVVAWLWTRGGQRRLFAEATPTYELGRPFEIKDAAAATAPPAPPLPPPAHIQPATAEAPIPDPNAGLTLHPMDAWAGTSGLPLASGEAASGRGRGPAGPDDAVAQVGPARPENAYAQRLHGTATPDAVAGVMVHPEWIVAKGTIFHCLPQQPLDTQLPGPVKCLVTDEVWSADGTNLLIERGSTVNGEMQRGLDLGQDRAFILWTDLLTTHFVTITLDSPAADDLGQIGAPGRLNEHLWAKIKAAVLLTAVQTASDVATNAVQAAGATSLSIGSYGPSLAEQALAHDLNIPTTLYRNQAQPLTVYVNRNLDFSRAYRDEIRAGATK